jgi:hypothetical protein
MNASSLVARVSRRISGYDPSEILDEVNAAYKEAWDYITQLEDSYFTEQQTVTVVNSSDTFDFLYNANGNLSSSVSIRYFQITRIQVKQPNDTNFVPANPRDWNSPDVLALTQDSTQPISATAPYLYTLYGKGFIKFARPVPAGTQFRVVYNFVFMPLVMLTNGQVAMTGKVVTGTGTNFTQMVGGDYQGSLPGVDGDTDVGMEFVFSGQNQNLNPFQAQTYRVQQISSDTSATLFNAPSPPPPAASPYVLASVPDIPEGHHNVISTIATRNFMSTPANDSRFMHWVALAKTELDAMRDSIQTRQKQEPPRRGKFPFGLVRTTASPTVTR